MCFCIGFVIFICIAIVIFIFMRSWIAVRNFVFGIAFLIVAAPHSYFFGIMAEAGRHRSAESARSPAHANQSMLRTLFATSGLG